MPPRRSGRVPAAAEQHACAFPQLPLPLVLRIFLLLPADLRLRCAEVSRAWRATVALPALWRRLDLSPASGVTQPPELLHALLKAAVAHAGTALTAINVSGIVLNVGFLWAALRATRGAMEEVHTSLEPLDLDAVATTVALAPRLRELHADVRCDCAEAATIFDIRQAFPPLRLRTLTVSEVEGGVLSPALATDLADARMQPGMVELKLWQLDIAGGAFDALADAVVARRHLCHLALFGCTLPPAAAPALARALRDGCLTELTFVPGESFFLDAASGTAVAAALRANSTLTSLSLRQLPMDAAPVAAILLGSLVGHHGLRKLSMSWTRLDGAAAGAYLGALIAADAPALTELALNDCRLGEAGLGALCDALPNNKHLQVLLIRDNPVPAGFMRSRLLPAVRANTSLRRLVVDAAHEVDAEAVEAALRIVEAR